MDQAPELRFVTVERPGAKRQPEDARAVRSHVRRAVSRNKKQKPANETIRFVTQKLDRKSRRRVKPSIVIKSAKELSAGPEKDTSVQTRNDDLAIGAQTSKSTQTNAIGSSASEWRTDSGHRSASRLPVSPVVRHPLTSFAEPLCSLAPERLDALFKSGKS